MILIAAIFVLVTDGVYPLLQRSMVRTMSGLGLLNHAVNLVPLATGVLGWWTEPITNDTNMVTVADPLPQAFVLTAVAITLATSILMPTMAVIGHNDNMLHHPETGKAHYA